jgi:Trypsin-co-occurring domain 1
MDAIEVVEVTLSGGQTMLARVHNTDPVATGPRDVGLREQLSFAGVTDTLRQIGGAVVDAIGQVRPERASVEFGLDLAVKSGKLTGLLVEGDATATLKVTLEWQRTTPSAVTPAN